MMLGPATVATSAPHRHCTSWVRLSCSEFQGQRHLPQTGHVLVRDRPERRTRRCGVRSKEIGMVPRVDTLRAVLQLDILFDRELLNQREIPARLSVPSDTAEAERGNANVIGERLGGVTIESGVYIEPLIRSALVLRQPDIVRIAREQRPHVAESERWAALPLHHCVQLPAAHKEVDRLRQVVAELFSLSEGQIPNSGYDQ